MSPRMTISMRLRLVYFLVEPLTLTSTDRKSRTI